MPTPMGLKGEKALKRKGDWRLPKTGARGEGLGTQSKLEEEGAGPLRRVTGNGHQSRVAPGRAGPPRPAIGRARLWVSIPGRAEPFQWVAGKWDLATG